MNGSRRCVLLTAASRTHRVWLFTALLCAPVTVLAQLAEVPWPLLKNDPALNSDQSSEDGQRQLQWRFAIAEGPSAPAIGRDGTIYVGADDGHLYARTPDGVLKWEYQTGAAIVSAPAVGNDGSVYVATSQGGLFALGPDGGLRWKYRGDAVITSAPALGRSGSVYAGTSEGLFALTPEGDFEWEYRTAGAIGSAPAVAADGTIYAGADQLYALGPDGAPLWKYQTDAAISSGPVTAADGSVYVGADQLYAIDSDGNLQWKYHTGTAITSAPAIAADGSVYVGTYSPFWGMISQGNHVCALGPDGTFKWKHQISGSVGSSPAVGADGTIYVGADQLYALGPDGGLEWTYKTGGSVGSTPAIASDGTIYVTSYLLEGIPNDFSGQVHALSPANATAVANAGPPSTTPQTYNLFQNVPNPFNPETAIRYQIPHSGPVRLAIYNPMGQRVRILVEGEQRVGLHEVSWDGRDSRGRALSSGVYLYRLEAGAHKQTRKLLLLR